MKKDRSVIIIGAGIGGIATALYLAKKGFKVEVYEKNATPGGRCGQLIREGHRFDLGATIFLMPNVYRKIFDSWGLKLEECFETIPLHTIYTLYFEDDTRIGFTTNLNQMQSQLEDIEPGSFNRFLNYIASGYKKYTLAFNNLIGRNFYNIFEFASFRNVLLLLKLKTYLRHVRYAGRFFKNDHLKKAFTFQNIYVGQNPLKAPALFIMIPAAELVEGSMAIKGGMYGLVSKLCSLAGDLGVKFFYNFPVEKIETGKNKVKGVVLKNGEKKDADIVVANADLPYVCRELLADKRFSRRAERMRYTCSAIVFHWGLKKVYPQLGHHSVFLSDKYHDNLILIFKKKSLSGEPSFYVHAPVRSDPDAAPAGHDTLSVIIPAGHIDSRFEQDWVKLKDDARKSVIARLARAGLTDLEKNIKFEISYLPGTWKNMFNLSRGATFGSLNHNIMQMGYFRPHNQHKRYSNLFFAGGSTHPGNGVPLVLMSARLTSERILKMTGD
ncbi:MAG: phytoene desaturase [Bacteroidales bacterium]|nr:phytoene desaturase [Bacteroidales bacterium]